MQPIKTPAITINQVVKLKSFGVRISQLIASSIKAILLNVSVIAAIDCPRLVAIKAPIRTSTKNSTKVDKSGCQKTFNCRLMQRCQNNEPNAAKASNCGMRNGINTGKASWIRKNENTIKSKQTQMGTRKTTRIAGIISGNSNTGSSDVSCNNNVSTTQHVMAATL